MRSPHFSLHHGFDIGHGAGMQRLKEIRKAKGLNQTILSERSGVSQSLISKIERGEANPTMEVMRALAGALETTPGSLFGTSEMPPDFSLLIELIPVMNQLDMEDRERVLRFAKGLLSSS